MTSISKTTALFGFTAMMILCLLASACKEFTPVEPEPSPEPDPVSQLTFEEVLLDGGVPSNPQTFETVDTTPSSTPQQIINEDIWSCTDFEVDISQNADDFVLYGAANAEIIYPGNLLQGQSVSEGAPKIIPLKRGPLTMTINTLNGSEVVANVDEVSYSQVAQATNDLIGSNNGNLSANISLTREEIHSLEELGVQMNAEYSNLTTKIKGSFDYNSSHEFSSVFVKVTQSLYKIITDIPDVETSFDESVTAEDLQKYVYQGNPATYISSVDYGRIFYLLIQSTQTAEEIKLAIDASFKGVVVNASGSVDIQKVEELSHVKVSGYAYGGDANLASGALIGDMEDVKTFIEKGGSINNGAPISYVVKSLEDPSVIVAANLTTSYTVTECENITGGIPSFSDTRQSVGAACFTEGNPFAKMTLFDGVNNDMVGVSSLGDIVGPFGIWEWGENHTHPFRNVGVGAALNVRHDADPKKTYFFNKAGTEFAAYSSSSNSFGGAVPLWKWGKDYSCPFEAVGAAMDVSVGTREIACLFNYEGTEYTLFESGQFSTPRSIKDLQVRNRDEALEIPFDQVGAALRLHLTDADGNDIDRVIMAIFDGPGTQYVYYDMDHNVIVGPLGL